LAHIASIVSAEAILECVRQVYRCAGRATPLSGPARKAVPQPARSAAFVTAFQNVTQSQMRMNYRREGRLKTAVLFTTEVIRGAYAIPDI